MADVFSRLKERQEARVSALEQKKVEREETRRVEETADYFSQQVQSKKTAIVDLLDQAADLDKKDLPPHFEKLSTELRSLQKYVSDSTVFLTSYDFKIAQKQVNDLQQEISSRQDQLLPKKKFAFSSRKKEATSKQEEVKVQSTKVNIVDVNSKEIRDKKGAQLELQPDEVRAQDVHLRGMEECEVKVFGAPGTLHITNATKCRVLSGPVSGSVFLENCKDCVFLLACQQLRVHSTTSSHFYLHVTSRAIIEDSHQLTFAPYCWSYPDLASHYQEAGLDQGVNNWDKVDDFNWLTTKEHSPNWTVLPEEQRTHFPNS